MADSDVAVVPAATGALDGKLVEVHGVDGKVAVLEGARLKPAAETIEANGRRGWATFAPAIEESQSDSYIVETLEGYVLSVDEANLKECTDHVEPTDGGFDFIWPSSALGHESFARNVATSLRSKGYCVIQMKENEATRGKAVSAAQGRDDFTLAKEEFREAYLGRGTRSADKVAWLEGYGGPAEDPVAYYQQHVMNLSFLLGGVDRNTLGFRPWEYLSGTLLRLPVEANEVLDEAIIDAGTISKDDVEEGLVQKHLDFIQRRKVCMMYFIQNQGGSVELHPREDLGLDAVTLPAEPDKLLIFRHDLMGYSYQAAGGQQDLVLQSWFMEEPQEIVMESLDGDIRGVENILGGPALIPDKQVHVMVGHCRFPGQAYGHKRDWLAYAGQTDTFMEVPMGRFDMSFYYAEESEQFAVAGKSVSKHCGFLQDEEWRCFDSQFFGLEAAYAYMMAPCQRVCLEIAYEGFVMAGHSRKSLTQSPIYSCIADIGLDWDAFYGYNGDAETWVKVGPQSLSSANRLAYLLDMRGPINQVDTACSASMVGSNMVHAFLRQHKEKEVHEGHCTGFQNILTPWTFIGLSGAGMVGRAGRCLTFDQSANGFARGEGCGHLFMRMSDDVQASIDRLACMVCGFVNQDGRSASLTAPNGPSQQAAMRSSFLDGGIVAAECVATENHGTGTALGDPIECGSIRAVFRKREGQGALPITSGKSHMGHLEPSAGIIGILKTIVSQVNSAVPANCHIRSLNAHIEVDGFPCTFPIETLDLMTEHHYAGANGFGFGGTNARTDFWAHRLHRVREAPKEIVGRRLVLDKLGSSSLTHPRLETLDYLAVECARCRALMCWLCGEKLDMKNKGELHCCSRVRAEFASYDICSNCYTGPYQIGDNPYIIDLDGGNMAPEQTVYLTGTANGWSKLQAMEHAAGSADAEVYVGEIIMGDTLLEKFHISLLNKDGSREIFYPVQNTTNQYTSIKGPSKGQKDGDTDKYWLLDGRHDGVNAGTVYEIRFEWGTTSKSVSWGPAEAPSLASLSRGAQHQYSIKSNTFRWNGEAMQVSPADPTMWEFTGTIPSRGSVRLYFVRDEDGSQAIYPLVDAPSAAQTHVAVGGPDANRADRSWIIHGHPGEQVLVQLQVVNGQVKVTFHSQYLGHPSWCSTQGPGRRLYSVSGSWNDWELSAMECDASTPGVHRFQFIIGETGKEQFQFVVDQSWDQRIFPAVPRSRPGECLVKGPAGDAGHGKNWEVSGYYGQVMDITLDLDAEDQVSVVSCVPAM